MQIGQFAVIDHDPDLYSVQGIGELINGLPARIPISVFITVTINMNIYLKFHRSNIFSGDSAKYSLDKVYDPYTLPARKSGTLFRFPVFGYHRRHLLLLRNEKKA